MSTREQAPSPQASMPLEAAAGIPETLVTQELADFVIEVAALASDGPFGKDYDGPHSEGVPPMPLQNVMFAKTQSGIPLGIMRHPIMYDSRAPIRRDPINRYEVTQLRSGARLIFTDYDIELAQQGEGGNMLSSALVESRDMLSPDPEEPLHQLAQRLENKDRRPVEHVTFTAAQQVTRYVRLMELRPDTFADVQVAFEPATATELVATLSDWSIYRHFPLFSSIKQPDGQTSVEARPQRRDLPIDFLYGLSALPPADQRAAVGAVHTFDARLPQGAMGNGHHLFFAKFVDAAIAFDTAGNYRYEKTPVYELDNVLICDELDFLRGVYHAIHGQHNSNWVAGTAPTGEHVSVFRRTSSFDEHRGKVFADAFAHRLMPWVEKLRDALEIDPGLPQAEQIHMLYENMDAIENGQWALSQSDVAAKYPDDDPINWTLAYAKIEQVLTGGNLTPQQQAKLQRAGFDPDVHRAVQTSQRYCRDTVSLAFMMRERYVELAQL